MGSGMVPGNRIVSHVDERSQADALKAIDMALRLSPNDSQTNAWPAQRASAFFLLGRYTEAIEGGTIQPSERSPMLC
jgi:hypothetical protein